MTEILSLDAIVYQKCFNLHGIPFGSKRTGIIFCTSQDELLLALRNYYGYVYHTDHKYYIYDRYYGRRHYVIIKDINLSYYAILVKDVIWI